MQDANSPIMEELIFLHDFINIIFIFIISLVGFIILKKLIAYLISINRDDPKNNDDREWKALREKLLLKSNRRYLPGCPLPQCPWSELPPRKTNDQCKTLKLADLCESCQKDNMIRDAFKRYQDTRKTNGTTD